MPFTITQGRQPRVLFLRLETTAETGLHPRDATLPFPPILSGALLARGGTGCRLVELSPTRLPNAKLTSLIAEWDGIVTFEINFSELKYFRRLLSALPGRPAHTAAYGLLANNSPELILGEGIDYCVAGEAESSIPPLVTWLLAGKKGDAPKGLTWIENGIVVSSGPPDPVYTDDMPFVPAGVLRTNRYHKHSFPLSIGRPLRWGFILANRGCLFRCDFCSAVARQSINRERRACSPERLVDEMFYQASEGNRTVISIEDDLFTGDPDWTLKVCGLLKKKGWRLPWIIQTRFDCIAEEIAAELKAARCAGITCGLESGSDRILDILNKRITTMQIRKTAGLLRRLGFAARYTAMIGSPGETYEDLHKTFSLLRELNPLSVHLYYCTPYPDTPYSQDIEHEENLNRLDAVPPANMSEIDTKGLSRLRFFFYLRFYFSVRYLSAHASEWTGYLIFNPARAIRQFSRFFSFLARQLLSSTGAIRAG